MRKTVLYLAVSIDGYLARTNGSVDWLFGQDPQMQSDKSYESFIKGVDTVVMGWNTYRQVVTELSPNEWPYQGLAAYVITHRDIPAQQRIFFTGENPGTLIRRIRQQKGKDIWICGGAQIVRQLIQEDLVDKFCLSIIPVILGNGIPLFEKMERDIRLRLVRTKVDNGIVELLYEKDFHLPSQKDD